ncbi:MAG: ankyrin repeat domain-containing protein [Rickettsiaceae bacterium]|nr:ankyrin repeat domain-containing protein [Rickettsiaceae bacterium]
MFQTKPYHSNIQTQQTINSSLSDELSNIKYKTTNPPFSKNNLYFAIAHGYIDVVEKMTLYHHPQENLDLINLMLIAVNNNQVNVLDYLYKRFGNKKALNYYSVRTPTNDSFLAIASKHRNLEMVKKLLSFNADPNIGNHKTNMPLINAILNGDKKIVKALIKGGARLDVVSVRSFSEIDKDGNCKFFEEKITVLEAIKKAPNSEKMSNYLQEIQNRGEFFTNEILSNGASSCIFDNLDLQNQQTSEIMGKEITDI